MIEATPDAVYKRVSQDHWEKTWAKVEHIHAWLGTSEDPPLLPRKDLERARGFLVYVALTYTVMTPYLQQGIHLTLESWRPDRDKDGWRQVPRSGDSGLTHHLGK